MTTPDEARRALESALLLVADCAHLTRGNYRNMRETAKYVLRHLPTSGEILRAWDRGREKGSWEKA